MPTLAHNTLIPVLLVGVATAAEKITYDDHVFPIFEQSCLNCHNPDKAKGGLDLSSFQNTLKGGSGGKIVEVGDLSSKLIAVVRQTSEPIMPPEGDALAGAQIKTLEAWISGGLLENASSKAKKPSKPKFDPALAGTTADEFSGPAPLPYDLCLEPVLVAPRSTAIHAMALSPTAPLLAVTGQGQVTLYHSGQLELLGILPFPEGEPTSLAFTPNGRYLIVGGGIAGKSGITISFDVTTGERMLTVGKEFDSILGADLSPDLSQVVTGSPSKRIKLWNSDDGSLTNSIKKHTDWVTSVDFSNDGILLATADRNGGAWVWEAATGSEFHTLRGHQAGIQSARFRTDSNLLATASEDGSVRMWEMNGGTTVKKIDAHGGGVVAFAWGQDGTFATAGRDKKAKLWKADFNPHKTLPELEDIPTALALDSTRKRLFIADYQGHISVHETAGGKAVGTINANPPQIASRLADIDSRRLAARENYEATASKHREQVASVKNLVAKVAQTAKAVNESKSKLQACKQQSNSIQKSVGTSKEKIGGLVSQEAQAAENLNNQRAPLEAQKANLHQAEQEVARITGELNKLQANHQAIEAEAASEAKAAKLNSAINKTESHQLLLVNAKQHLNKQKEGIKPLDEALAQAQQHSERIQGQLTQERQQLAIHEKLLSSANEAASLDAQQLAKLEATLPDITKQLEQAKKTQKQTGGLHWKARNDLLFITHQERRWKRAELHLKIRDTRIGLAAREREAEELSLRFAEANRNAGQLQIELAEFRGQIKQLQLRKAEPDLAADPTKLSAIEAATRSTIATLTERLDSVSQQLATLRTQLDAAFVEIHQLRFRLSMDEIRHQASAGTSE